MRAAGSRCGARARSPGAEGGDNSTPRGRCNCMRQLPLSGKGRAKHQIFYSEDSVKNLPLRAPIAAGEVPHAPAPCGARCVPRVPCPRCLVALPLCSCSPCCVAPAACPCVFRGPVVLVPVACSRCGFEELAPWPVPGGRAWRALGLCCPHCGFRAWLSVAAVAAARPALLGAAAVAVGAVSAGVRGSGAVVAPVACPPSSR